MKYKKAGKTVISVFLAVILVLCGAFGMSVNAVKETSISYTFSGGNSETAGYAEGTISFYADSSGTYELYWADDNGKLDGYSSITSFTFSGSGTNSFSFGYHTAIPKGATKIIALKNNVKAAEYTLPENKVLNAGKLLYTFNSYSDIHIDENGFYIEASKRWTQALKFGVNKNTDFIVTSGDTVTNAAGPDGEWDKYEKLLSESDYVNPVWESDGNHDMRCGVESGLKSFIRATGTDNTAANYDSNKPYYYIIEKGSGDVFIFMALEGSTKSDTSGSSQFSDAQLNWLDNLLKKYYNTGVNVYIVEHAPINGFGAGDRMSKPYYKGHLSESFESTLRFKEVLKNYPGLIFMSGHTHEDFSMGYNYSNENNTACNMIHNPSVAGTTKPNNPDDGALDYYGGRGKDAKGIGYNSQGYYVEVFDNEVIFYGADISTGLIYPEYSYIMEGARSLKSGEDETETATFTESSSVSQAETTKSTEAETVGATTENTIASTAEETEPVTQGTSNTAIETTAPATQGASGTASETTAPATQEGTESVQETTSSEAQGASDTAPDTTDVEYKTGDVNMDGGISIKDVTLIQKAIARLVSLSAEQEELADTDFNGRVNIKDATLIQKYIAKLIDSFEKNSTKKTAMRTGESGFSAELTKVHQILSSYYSFASYDQYQELKKLYYKYKDSASVEDESAVIAEFENKKGKLFEIAEHIGVSGITLIGDTYYFENTNNWSEVYAYAWTGSSNNASWPGVKIKKVGTNSGHDVYKIKFDSPAQYTSIIFNGGKDKPQTVNISLEKYKGNCFYLDGTSSDGKLNVGNFTYKANPDSTEPSGSDNSYALYYYTANHSWGYENGSVFSKNSDGSYSYEYTSPDSNNLSFNVYNVKTKKFNCVSSSTLLTYSINVESEYSLSESSSKGQSITVYGLSAGAVLKLTYKPSDNKVSVLCK